MHTEPFPSNIQVRSDNSATSFRVAHTVLVNCCEITSDVRSLSLLQVVSNVTSEKPTQRSALNPFVSVNSFTAVLNHDFMNRSGISPDIEFLLSFFLTFFDYRLHMVVHANLYK